MSVALLLLTLVRARRDSGSAGRVNLWPKLVALNIGIVIPPTLYLMTSDEPITKAAVATPVVLAVVPSAVLLLLVRQR